MSKRNELRKSFDVLNASGMGLLKKYMNKDDKDFMFEYQKWYTNCLRVVEVLAKDRLAEFRSYYESNPKKPLAYSNYGIQDSFKGVAPSSSLFPDFDVKRQVEVCMHNQVTILNSLNDRVDSILSDIEGEIYAELKDTEIEVARRLTKVNLRAAGALAGVLVEGHLQKAASARQVAVSKKNPTIADLNEALKAANVIDVPTWRKITYLGDIRNICSHKKDVEPTKDQVDELLNGVDWLIKNV